MTDLCPFCGDPIPIRKRGGPKRRICDKPECSKARNRKNGLAYYHAHASAHGPKGTRLMAADAKAPLKDLNRGDREKFIRYMEENPFYLRSIFPGLTPSAAWMSSRMGRGLR